MDRLDGGESEEVLVGQQPGKAQLVQADDADVGVHAHQTQELDVPASTEALKLNAVHRDHVQQRLQDRATGYMGCRSFQELYAMGTCSLTVSVSFFFSRIWQCVLTILLPEC